jgi:hypothetical protein
LKPLSEVRVCPKCSTAARHPVFDLKQNRREVEHERPQCAVLLCAGLRVSALRNVFVRGHRRENVLIRADRGQRAVRLCFCGRQAVSDTIPRPFLAVASACRVTPMRSARHSKKCASFAKSARDASSRQSLAITSRTRTRDENPHAVTARTGGGASEELGQSSMDGFQIQAESLRSGEWAASVRRTTVHCTTGCAWAKRFSASGHQAKIENASYSRSTAAVAVLSRLLDGVRHCAASAVCNRIAQFGRVDLVVALFKKCASFPSRPRDSSSRPDIAVVSTLRVRDTKPLALAATT